MGAQLPKHIAIIMDGNGRWAKRRKHNRVFGHSRGVERARSVTRECAKLGIEALTLYTFSTENWNRPETEVNFLMKLLLRYLKHETQELIENNLRFKAIGFLNMLPKAIQTELSRLEQATSSNTGMRLNIALSYGSRQELTSAFKALAHKLITNEMSLQDITEQKIEEHLFTRECPDPDLLIRTGGEQRISNFLLWQMAYTELYFVEKCWPDFEIADLKSAIDSFDSRERRFGNVGNESRA
ncbi:MAG: isoprenyl transferase [Oligoflexia bacterium]|nr:isoprenyl transferase [Oligoflexia bacterium]